MAADAGGREQALARMDTHIAVGRIEPPKLSDKLEAALVEGDLSKLTVVERVQFYNATCDSLGINPLTKPFGYIVLNGKLTLYALKACTDQLREKRGVSIGQLREEERDGIFTVYAPATDRSGRTDEDMGAVVVANLKGENLCNAKMKAVTKAKRRVTLSICGLGMLDETEVVTIPGVRLTDEAGAGTQTAPIATPRRVDASRTGDALAARGVRGGTARGARRADADGGDSLPLPPARSEAPPAAPEPPAHAPVGDDTGAPDKIAGPLPGCVSQNQIAMLMSLCHAKGVDEAALKNHLGTAYGYESRWQIKKGDELSAIMLWVSEHSAPPKSHARLVCRTRPRPGGRR